MSTPQLVVSVPTPQQLDALGTPPQGVELLLWPVDGPAPRDHIDLVVLPYLATHAPLANLHGVTSRLVQSPAIGYDGIEPKLPQGCTFANGATVHETSTAEMAVTLALAAQRGVPDFVSAQAQGDWPARTVFRSSLADRRVVLLGYGGVGKAIADRLEPFEVDLHIVATREREQDGRRIRSMKALDELLPTADVVIVAVPLSAATTHLVDDAFLAALPDGALVVNVARGAVADTDALVAHARAQRIRLALDVVDPEPLPRDHPLWSIPGVLISPHAAAATDAMHPRMTALVRRQIDHMLQGEAPENVVIRT